MSMLVSTDGIARSDRLEYWGEVICGNFCEADFDRPVCREDFHGSVDLTNCGSLRFGRIQASAQHVLRTPRRIARSNRALFFLIVQLQGHGYHRQAERVGHLAPGDFLLVDATRPFDLIFTDAFSQLSWCLPHDMVMGRLPDAPQLTARAVSGRAGTGRVASVFVRQLALQAQSIAAASFAPLEATLLELVAAALSEQRDCASPASERKILLTQRVLQYIETHLGNPDLSCSTVAERHGISERYLLNLFKELATRPSEWIWRRRLERAREDLVTPSRRGLSITTICYRWGFKDTAHFSHAFKAQFGCTPSEARTTAGQRP